MRGRWLGEACGFLGQELLLNYRTEAPRLGVQLGVGKFLAPDAALAAAHADLGEDIEGSIALPEPKKLGSGQRGRGLAAQRATVRGWVDRPEGSGDGPGLRAGHVGRGPGRSSARPRRHDVSGHTGWERRGTALVNGWVAALDFAARSATWSAWPASCSSATTPMRSAAPPASTREAPAAGASCSCSRRAAFVHRRCGVDRVRGDARLTLARRQNRSAYGSVIFSLTPEVQASFEYRWLRRSPATPIGPIIISTGCWCTSSDRLTR